MLLPVPDQEHSDRHSCQVEPYICSHSRLQSWEFPEACQEQSRFWLSSGNNPLILKNFRRLSAWARLINSVQSSWSDAARLCEELERPAVDAVTTWWRISAKSNGCLILDSA